VKSYRLDAAAEADVITAHAYYLDHANADVADGFLESLDDSITHICLNPGTGSLRYAIPDSQEPLRFWTLGRFPYAVFYMERESLIEIIRVLHQASDIPTHLD
jgi:toxin ParE1/3/4